MLRRVRRWSAVLVVLLGTVSGPAFGAGTETPQSIAHYIMGVAAEFDDNPQKAAFEYQRAAEADPAAFAAHMRLGILSSQLGDNANAIRAFSSAAALQPEDLQVRYLLALSYSSGKDPVRAAAQYETILKTFISKEPENVEFYIYLAELYLSQGRLADGVAQYEKAIALEPENTEALLEVGAFYLDGSRRPEGLALLQRCVDKDPAHAMCLNALGYAYAEDRVRLDEAEDLVKRALAVMPDNPAYLDSLGWVYAAQGKLAEALDLLKKALALQEDPEIYAHIGDVYEKLDQTDKALEAWRKALAMDPAMAAMKEKIERYQKISGKK